LLDQKNWRLRERKRREQRDRIGKKEALSRTAEFDQTWSGIRGPALEGGDSPCQTKERERQPVKPKKEKKTEVDGEYRARRKQDLIPGSHGAAYCYIERKGEERISPAAAP